MNKVSRVVKNKKLIALSLAAFSLVSGTVGVFAQASEDTVINASLGSTISITTSGTVSLPITPIIGGSQTTAADTVTVATNNTTGYTLSIRDSDTDTALVNGVNTIDAHAGTAAAPTVLANNSWGYRLDDGGATTGFGGGPTAGSIDQAANSSLFAGVTTSNAIIKTTAAPAAADVTSVYFSAKADTSKPNGTYTGTVLYTATTN